MVTLKAYITEYAFSVDIHNITEKDVHKMVFLPEDHEKAPSTWACVGLVHVDYEPIDSDAVVNNKIASLRAEIQQAYDEVANKVKYKQDQIHKLLAIAQQ